MIFPIDYDLSSASIDLSKDCYPIEAPDSKKFKLSSSFTCKLHNDHKNWIEFLGNEETIQKG